MRIAPQLLTTSSHKWDNSPDYGYLTAGVYLAPHSIATPNSGTMCGASTPECRKHCLFYSGRGNTAKVYDARVRRTDMFLSDNEYFYKLLFAEVEMFQQSAYYRGLIPTLRPNATSDKPEIALTLADRFPELQIVDYTKINWYYEDFLNGKLPKNIHLTFSRSEKNERKCLDYLRAGGTCSIVFNPRGPFARKRKYHGYRILNGAAHDLRFLDGNSVWVGLPYKGGINRIGNSSFVA